MRLPPKAEPVRRDQQTQPVISDQQSPVSPQWQMQYLVHGEYLGQQDAVQHCVRGECEYQQREQGGTER